MITLLTLITCLAALVFLAVVALALTRIVALLESIGGKGDSYLAKLRLGLRAIERETSHLPAAAPGPERPPGGRLRLPRRMRIVTTSVRSSVGVDQRSS